MREFCNLELGRDTILDEIATMNFRPLLEHQELTKAILSSISVHLEEKSPLFRSCTILNATPIAFSPSTNSEERQHDPQMRRS